MPVDFGLVGPTDMPMRANTFKPIDAVGNTEKAYTLAGVMVDNQEKVRKSQEDQAFRDILKNYSAQDGTDLVTPTGLKRAMKDLQGKIPPDKLMALGQTAQKAELADLTFREHLSKANDAEIASTASQINQAYPVLTALMEQHAADKAAKGKEYADAQFKENQTKSLQLLGQSKLASGQPAYSPAVLQQIAQVDSDHLPGVIKQLKGHKDAVATQLSESRARALDAGGGSGKAAPQAFAGPDGKEYTLRPNTGEWTRNGEPVEPGDVPIGELKKIGSKGAGQPVVADPKLTDHENMVIAQISQALGGRPIPGIPAGQGNTSARISYLRAWAQLAEQEGMDPQKLGDLTMQRRAAASAEQNLTKQNAILEQSEVELRQLMKNMEAEARKIGGPASPAMRELWNKAMTRYVGSDKFSAINVDSPAAQEIIGRVSSNNTGAGGTAVSFLKLAQDMITSGANADQIKKAASELDKLVAARHAGVDSARKTLSEQGRVPTPSADRVSPAKQAERDAQASAQADPKEFKGSIDAARAELKKVLEGIRGASPEAKTVLEIRRREVEGSIKSLESTKSAVEKSGFKVYEPDKYEYMVDDKGVHRKPKKNG